MKGWVLLSLLLINQAELSAQHQAKEAALLEWQAQDNQSLFSSGRMCLCFHQLPNPCNLIE